MIQKRIKIEIFEWIICFAFFFRQIAKIFALDGDTANTLGGNIDPFYLIIIPFIILICKKKYVPKWFMIVNFGMIMYALFQCVIWDDINYVKLFVNVTKIFICVSILYMSISYADKVNYDNIIEKCTFLFGVFTLYSVSIGNASNIIWRMNDVVNTYSLKRLTLFYLEPSELGFHVAVLMIFLVAKCILAKEVKERVKFILLATVNLIALMFAKPMGAICCLALAILVMVIMDFLVRFRETKVVTIGFMTIVCIVVIMLMYINGSNIIMRVIDTLNGTDKSNAYRVGTANEVLISSIEDYYGLGCGFGNSGTESFMLKYHLPTGIVNSFGRFIIETGIFGLLFLMVLVIVLLYRTINSKDILKYGLLIFLLSYQIFGSHFTNALIWWLYGYIISAKTSYQYKGINMSNKNNLMMSN